MHPTINTCYLLLFCWLCVIRVTAQFPQPAFRHYTPDHGLPSSECYDLIQDRKGYIWISTDNGVSRFNGYEFENFGSEQGLKNNVVLYMQEDHQGRIWMMTLAGNAFLFENDTIKAYSYNHDLQKQKTKGRITDFYIDSNETFYGAFYQNGFIKIFKDGNVQLLEDSTWCRVGLYPVDDKKVLHSYYNTCHIIDGGKLYNNLIFLNNRTKRGRDLVHKHIPNIGTPDHPAFRIQEGILYSKGYELFFFQDESLVWRTPMPRIPNCWYQNKDGELVVGFSYGDGASRYKNLAFLKNNTPSGSYLKNYEVSHILEDKSDGFWLATNEAGVFYSSNPEVKVYNKDSGLSDALVSAIALKNQNEIYIGCTNGDVFLLDEKQEKLSNLPKQFAERELLDLYYDKRHRELWKGARPLQYYSNNKWQFVPMRYPNGQLGVASSNKILSSRNPNKLWNTTASIFFSINLTEKKIDFNCYRGCSATGRTFTIYEDFNNHIWLGRIDGLYQFYEQDTTLRPERSHPAFSLRVEDIQQMADSTLVVGTKGGGIVLWKDSSYLQISEKDGLTASMIENIHIDSAQHIWAGTLNGLNKITRYRQDSFFIKTYTTANGLPSNEINDIDSWGSDVWVATTRGLVKLPDTDEINRYSPAPRLEKVLINGVAVDPKAILSLPYNQNNLEINLLTINYKLNGKINYRYRLGKNSAWNITQNRRINFPKLPSANYFFEVQSQNEDGVWSDSTVWAFGITPPFWKRWWFFTLLVLSVSSLAYIFYRNRVNLLKEEAKNQRERAERVELEQELNELERATLRAQMNPHFLSNCLNAIQGFISKGEKMKAMRYLSEFNDLLRETLELSQQKTVPLEEDINLLIAYLNLEKMRFDGKFAYEIDTDKAINRFNTEIPPLLIQPFVENAIVHAFPKEVSDPSIHITYAQKNGELLVTVTDNGVGLTAGRARKSASPFGKRKSFGMEIPQMRLGILSDTAQTVVVEELKDKNGKVLGTKVSVHISLAG